MTTQTQTRSYTVPARSVRKMSLTELYALGQNFGVTATDLMAAYRAPLGRTKKGKFVGRRAAAANVVLKARRSEANRQGHVSRQLQN